MSALVTNTADSASMTPSCRGGSHKRCTTDENGCGCRCHRVGAEIQAMEDAAAGLIETLLREWFKDNKSGFVPSIEAQKFVAAMREQHPTEFTAWLQDRAEWLVLNLMRTNEMLKARNAGAGSNSRRSFANYAAAIESGKEPNQPALAVTYRVNLENMRRTLADMTAVDLKFASEQRESQANSLKLEAAFLRAIAKRLPDDTTKVGDVLDEHQVYEIRKKLQPKST